MSLATFPIQLNLVTFAHLAADCPVKQATPGPALLLSQRIGDAEASLGKIPGAFLPADHRGVALAQGDANEVLGVYQDILSAPRHKIKVYPLEDNDQRLAVIVNNPSVLEGDSSEAVANRALLFETANRIDPKAGYGESVANATPSLSLFELKDFLKQKAAEISNSAQ